MNFGKKIKELRLQKTVTQEQFAAYLNISPQAVSKWENNLTLPDIQLLPDISVYFGVTIDELFEMTDEKHLQRIEHMVHSKRTSGRFITEDREMIETLKVDIAKEKIQLFLDSMEQLGYDKEQILALMSQTLDGKGEQ